MSRKASEILAQALGLVTSAGTTGAFARNKEGREVLVDAEDACTYCSLGAVAKVAGVSPYSHALPGMKFLSVAAEAVWPNFTGSPRFPWVLNDTKPELIPAMFHKAIELAKLEEGSC